jgi:hypothetical protein
MSNEYETLRWPTNMDRGSIVVRLVEIRELARANNRPELAAFFADVEEMPSPRIGANVISALSWIEGKPDYKAFGTQLSMIAMNLKNLK